MNIFGIFKWKDKNKEEVVFNPYDDDYSIERLNFERAIKIPDDDVGKKYGVSKYVCGCDPYEHECKIKTK